METTRTILCTDCSDVAVEVDEHLSAESAVRYCAARERMHRCRTCQAPGRVEVIDDGEVCALVFRAA